MAKGPYGQVMASVHQRYRIIDKIDAGGMAEIYRGVAVSMDGFERSVAIKRILPSLTQDQKFVTMFLDEARLSMQLTHANIVQILDLGKIGETYFMTMELVDGANLRKLMQRSLDMGRPFPVNVACFIAMEMAKGLAYAHEKIDAKGHSLGIVHRDVSPPNVLLSRQGEVKVTDFGLAKARSNVSVSENDVVKGKFAYLAPEVVDGKEPDARADIYAIGIILWEMLSGRRLFSGKTDMETVDLVRKGEVLKLTKLREDIDEDLDKIIQRTLAKAPKRRVQTCREFEQEVAGYLAKKGWRATSGDLANFVRELLDADIEAETIDIPTLLHNELEELQLVGKLDATLGQVPLKGTDLKARSVSKLDAGKLLDRLDGEVLDDLADPAIAGGFADRFEPGAEAQAKSQIAKRASGDRPAWLIPAALVGVVVVAAAAWLLLGHK